MGSAALSRETIPDQIVSFYYIYIVDICGLTKALIDAWKSTHNEVQERQARVTSWFRLTREVAMRAIGITGIIVAVLLRLVSREPKRVSPIREQGEEEFAESWKWPRQDGVYRPLAWRIAAMTPNLGRQSCLDLRCGGQIPSPSPGLSKWYLSVESQSFWTRRRYTSRKSLVSFQVDIFH